MKVHRSENLRCVVVANTDMLKYSKFNISLDNGNDTLECTVKSNELPRPTLKGTNSVCIIFEGNWMCTTQGALLQIAQRIVNPVASPRGAQMGPQLDHMHLVYHCAVSIERVSALSDDDSSPDGNTFEGHYHYDSEFFIRYSKLTKYAFPYYLLTNDPQDLPSTPVLAQHSRKPVSSLDMPWHAMILFGSLGLLCELLHVYFRDGPWDQWSEILKSIAVFSVFVLFILIMVGLCRSPFTEQERRRWRYVQAFDPARRGRRTNRSYGTFSAA